jgi:hypothetical protein
VKAILKNASAGALIALGLVGGIPILCFGALLAIYSLRQCAPANLNHAETLASFIVEGLANLPCLITRGHWLSVVLGVVLVFAGIMVTGLFVMVAEGVKNRSAARLQPTTAPLPKSPVRQPEAPAPVATADSRSRASAFVLKIGPVTRVLTAGTSIEPVHLGAAGAGRGKGPIAEIVANPREPQVLGLRNVSDRVYRAKLPTGKAIELLRDHTMRLSSGVVIDFGGIEGMVLTQEALQKSSKA